MMSRISSSALRPILGGVIAGIVVIVALFYPLITTIRGLSSGSPAPLPSAVTFSMLILSIASIALSVNGLFGARTLRTKIGAIVMVILGVIALALSGVYIFAWQWLLNIY